MLPSSKLRTPTDEAKAVVVRLAIDEEADGKPMEYRKFAFTIALITEGQAT